MLLKTRN